MITSCNHSENIICGSCLMKNHQEKQKELSAKSRQSPMEDNSPITRQRYACAFDVMAKQMRGKP